MIKKIFFFIFIVECLFLFLSSCQKGSKCFHSYGEETQQTRYFSNFKRLRINSLMNVYWHLDSQTKVVIKTGSKLLPYIKTELTNETLAITNLNRCNWLRKYKRIEVHIYSPAFKYIDLYGSGDFYLLDTLRNDTIRVDNWSDISKVSLLVKSGYFSYSQNAGTGDTYISGSAGICFLWAMGYGYIHARNFKTGYNYITHKSTGNFYVNVEKEVGANLFSSGHVYVYGKPYLIEQKSYSTGKLIVAE
ncbi:MAG: DUF2807 domain-containing protein [Bacteroidales bacterium]|nr:DUF2807 domain-containing protein [Bacteroidales bacterium]